MHIELTTMARYLPSIKSPASKMWHSVLKAWKECGKSNTLKCTAAKTLRNTGDKEAAFTKP